MFNRILVTMDKTESINQSTFEAAMALAKANQARLMLLQVLPCEGDTCAPDLETLRSLREQAKTAGLASDTAQILGEPEQIICDMASRWGADLIVLGQDGESCTWPVLPRFAQSAPCSVLVAQQPDSLHLQPSQIEQLAMMN